MAGLFLFALAREIRTVRGVPALLAPSIIPRVVYIDGRIRRQVAEACSNSVDRLFHTSGFVERDVGSRWDRISQLRLLFPPAMYGVRFWRRQLLHAEWSLSELSVQARSSTLKPDADVGLGRSQCGYHAFIRP